MSAFNAGEITLMDVDLTGSSALGSSGRYEVWDYNTTQMLYLGFNAQQGLCRDADVRRAIAQAVDPQDLFRSTGQAYVRLAREEPHLFQLYLFQPRDQVASLADLYARETNPAVPAKIAADLGISPEAAQALHLHLLIYTIGIGTIFSVTSPGIPQEEIFQQQEEAYRAFLHHCLGGTQP